MKKTITEPQQEEQEVKTERPPDHALQRRAPMPIGLSAFGVVQPTNLVEAIELAKYIANSGMVPKDYIGQPGAVLVAMQMGAEVGLAPMAAIQNIAVINGRPCLWGDAMLAVVLAHPDCEDVIEDDLEDITKAGKAVCIVKREGRKPIKRTFSIKDADVAGLAGKNVWKGYPARMLQMRARGFALRDAFPDVLRGLGSAEQERDRVITAVEPLRTVDDDPVPGVHKVTRPTARAEPPEQPAADPQEQVVEHETTPPAEQTQPDKPQRDLDW